MQQNQHTKIGREQRQSLKQQTSFVLWFTGLPCSGKSTLAGSVEQQLFVQGRHTFILDGDELRQGLSSDLDFSIHNRHENIRRITEISLLFLNAGIICLNAVISPFRQHRETARQRLSTHDFIEIYCQAPLSVCEERDTKGLYKKARDGQITNFTGISSDYEIPENPQIIVNTAKYDRQYCTKQIIDYLSTNKKI